MNATPTGRELAKGIGQRIQRLELAVSRYKLAAILAVVAAVMLLTARLA